MNSIKELMTLYGYKFSGICQCDGFKTMKYKNGEYQLSWRVYKYQFKMKQAGNTIKAWTPVKDAEKYLSQLHNVTV